MNEKKQQSKNIFLKQVCVSMVLFFCGIFFMQYVGANLTSTNFQVENPTLLLNGGQASSTSFQYFSGTGEFTIGESTSTSFTNRAGFLYFPIATSPIVSTTAGNGQVVITWTPATGTFANITSYELGVATSVSGPFVYTSVGNVTTTTKTGLTNGITYYFNIKTYAAGIVVSESSTVSALPTAPVTGGGGGGGGGTVTTGTGLGGVNFAGRAYPNQTVVLLKDAQVISNTVAGPDAKFSISVTGLSSGNYVFSIYSQDSTGNRSALQTFPILVTSGVSSNIGGIFIAPTISVDKSQVKQGENIAIFGQSVPNAEVTISVHSEREIFNKTTSDTNGAFLYNFDTSIIEKGNHVTKSKTAKDGQISPFGKSVDFIVGDSTILLDSPIKKCPIKGDLNGDCRVNLIDYSMTAFWYRRPLNAPASLFELKLLNSDGKINLVDFSILAYYWTG